MRTVELNIKVTANEAMVWQDEHLYLLDQRLLPHQSVFIQCDDAAETAEAITAMVVRGAPAIGVTAAYGCALAVRQRIADAGNWQEKVAADFAHLRAARPTAVNLMWAIDQCSAMLPSLSSDNAYSTLLNFALELHAKDRADNKTMGEFGASLLQGCSSVITHCNTGGLATGGHGTALGVIRSAFAQGKINEVYADETRPWLQGARLTAWELVQENIPVKLMTDGACAARMAAGGITWAIVGSDRIAANGDVANKIGTYNLAVAAKYHGVKFMVAAPTSTIDLQTVSGADIEIETRDPSELLGCGGKLVAPEKAGAWNPVFDVTPASLVDAIVTEKGIILNPDRDKIAAHIAN